MGNTPNKTCLKRDLARELAEYRITASPLNPEFRFEDILFEVSECRVVKANSRRQVYHLQTPAGGYFLKRSTLVRAKDRLRHFILPRRRWAEWRNLHRLRRAQVPAARPLSKGLLNIRYPLSYFVLTEQVLGAHIPMNSFENAQSLGQYAAFLHRRRVYHADLNRHNLILTPQGQFCLIDVQEVFFLPGMPDRLRIHNLGRILFNFCTLSDPEQWAAELLKGYHKGYDKRISTTAVIRAAGLHRQRHYRSRSKRCCKNSTEFAVVKSDDWKGYRRKTFQWRPMDLLQALEKGQPIKGTHVISYRGVCIKKHPRRGFHSDRCRISWKMSRALEVRGIAVPRSLGYFVINNLSCFLAEFLAERCHLNTYLSALSDEQIKRKALKKLALWLRNFHDSNVWQRDFKSSNILCQNGDFFMVDLDGVRIRRLSEPKKIYNLAQLNASLSNAITIKDRLRFYHYYSADRQPTRPQRRAVYRKVWQITLTKNTALYDFYPEKCRWQTSNEASQ
ncbi:MAG: lipopolysaccharide kinase InaA family protein [Desulfobacteraceae bacterium]|nr:lipopolysaccharide kinase InaA family protein [Desulfobacteraceae bacterium]